MTFIGAGNNKDALRFHLAGKSLPEQHALHRYWLEPIAGLQLYK